MGKPSRSKSSALVRPTVLTPKVQKQIIQSLLNGMFLRNACEKAGVSHSCFYWWRKRVEDGDPDAQHLADFFDAVKKADATAEENALIEVRAGGLGWQGSAWYLERRFPQRWGRKATVVVERKLTDADLAAMTDEELEALKRGTSRRRT